MDAYSSPNRFSLGVTNDPSKLIASAFEDGESTRAFNTGIEFYFIFWVSSALASPLVMSPGLTSFAQAVASLIYFLSALRTNVVLTVNILLYVLTALFS